MDDSKAIRLLQEVIEKTESKKLTWSETAQSGIFVAPMKGKYTLKAYPWTTDGEGPPSITLYEDDKLVVDITYEVTGLSVQSLKNAYKMIRERVYRVDEKVDDALDFLSKL